jgi:hypothetical protein
MFDAMLLDPLLAFLCDFSDKWCASDTEEALALSIIDDARLKDCIINASASVLGVPTMHPRQLEVCFCILHLCKY